MFTRNAEVLKYTFLGNIPPVYTSFMCMHYVLYSECPVYQFWLSIPNSAFFYQSLHARLPEQQFALFTWNEVWCSTDYNTNMHYKLRYKYALYDFSMQKFDIKRKSDDIAGSASLAHWANMNQSTTQLGSKRQSQGKHPYPTINMFPCFCVVIVCPCKSVYQPWKIYCELLSRKFCSWFSVCFDFLLWSFSSRW